MVLVALAAAGCGGGTKTVSVTTTAPPATRTVTVPPSASDEVLTIPAVGRFYGRCPRGARVWTLRFVVPADAATEFIRYRIGEGPPRDLKLDPGGAVTVHLVPDAVRITEPADSISRHPATAIATTLPLDAQITQGTEPQFLRAAIHLALAAIGGETGECVLVGSRITARDYPNGSS